MKWGGGGIIMAHTSLIRDNGIDEDLLNAWCVIDQIVTQVISSVMGFMLTRVKLLTKSHTFEFVP